MLGGAERRPGVESGGLLAFQPAAAAGAATAGLWPDSGAGQTDIRLMKKAAPRKQAGPYSRFKSTKYRPPDADGPRRKYQIELSVSKIAALQGSMPAEARPRCPSCP